MSLIVNICLPHVVLLSSDIVGFGVIGLPLGSVR